MEKIDFEKLRKKMMQTDLMRSFTTGLFSDIGNANNVYEATPEQLIAMARRRNINLEKFLFKDKK